MEKRSEKRAKQGLLDLEWEVVLKILTFSGSKAICNAAATCTTINKMKAHLSTVPLFSSTMNNGPVETALKNAMDGMLGSIDFAFIAMQGNAKRDEVLEGIRKAGLPKSCQIIGGKAYGGSIGLIDGTIPWEIESDPPFVSVLLGRVPDRRVEAMDCRENGECGWNDECDFVMICGGGAMPGCLEKKKEKYAVVGGHTKSAFYGDINEIKIKTRGSTVALCFSPHEGGTVNCDEQHRQRSESRKARAEKEHEGDGFSPHVFGVESDPYVVIRQFGEVNGCVRGDAEDVEFQFEENLSAIVLEHTNESKHTEIYGILERSAKLTKTGPSATIIFACCERGEEHFGEPNVESSLVDEVAKGKMPIAGLFVGGEFGPDLRGWASANSETGILRRQRHMINVPSTSISQTFTKP
ncbi:hypothetical protein BSKO_10469 [Bryopsis sp. KO-2023]|nr:hypothetical protein BSKO_10469 [Bryopsis sp. KO-2023]